MIQKSYFIF